MRRYFTELGCPKCAYLFKAVYLANQHTGFRPILPVFVDTENLDYETIVMFRKAFGDIGYLPSLFVDDTVMFYYGLPPWKELYYTLVSLIRR